MRTLQNKIALYVPATYGNLLERANNVAVQFARLFDGSTITDATGLYKLIDGNIVTEQIKIVYAYTDDGTLESSRDDILALAESLRDKWDQESIAIEIDNTMILV